MAIGDALDGEKKRKLVETMNKFTIGSNHALLREVLRRFFHQG